MEKQIEKEVKKEKCIFYRVNIDHDDDFCMYDEKMVRYCLSAWVSNVDYSMKRLLRGEKVCTPVAYYVALEA